MTWQAGGTVGDQSCENRPDVFFVSAEGIERAGLVGIWVCRLVLMPDVKNRRKFSGERLVLAGWI